MTPSSSGWKPSKRSSLMLRSRGLAAVCRNGSSRSRRQRTRHTRSLMTSSTRCSAAGPRRMGTSPSLALWTGSRHDERNKMVNILVNANGRVVGGDLMVVPIVGMGGLGKTTLAQLIHNDPQVKEYFHLRKWVCVSDDFSVLNLANKICNASERDLEEAVKKLQEHLNGKRYLLVLDDVWEKDINFDKWRKIKAFLTQDVYGAVLVTTREKQVAEFMGAVVDSSWTNHYHEVAILGKEYIQEIIETRAFGLQRSKPDDLVELVDRIVERCVGSPLAAKAIGSVLRDKTTKEEWEAVLQPSTICDDKTGIMPILKLSYNDLPIDMQQCFAFCALYPKDYQIDMDKLIQLWMANGFISDQKKVPAETVGKRIVNELVSRSFFQYEERSWMGYNSTTFLKIHDLMHDLALSVSEKECVCITRELIKNSELLPSAARHILIQNWIGKEIHGYLYGSMRKMSRPIQTFMFDGSSEAAGVQHLSRYSSLRVLSVPGIGFHLTIKPKHQCHLRFLDIKDSVIKELPDDISVLYNLQTLFVICTQMGAQGWRACLQSLDKSPHFEQLHGL
uniref:NB-ARC domain-containing protein n=1 Tax=Zea mays TaxID=4577 RepID=A0A804NJA0_MAIZE